MALDERAVKFHTIGNTLMQDHKYNEAISNYHKALEMEPEYAAACYHLAEAYEAKKVDAKAVEFYTKAIEMNESYATVHIDSGLYTLLSGPLGLAVGEYKKKLTGAALDEEDDAVEVAAPVAGSPVDEATRPAVDKPRGKVGIPPLAFKVEPKTGNISSEVNSFDTIRVTVTGDKGIPVAQCPVLFEIETDPSLGDAFLALNKERAAADKGPRKLNLKTDNDGRVTVFLRRSKVAGLNRIRVEVADLVPQYFEDNTFPAAVTRVEMSPAEQYFQTAQQVVFTVKGFDRFENPAAGADIALLLHVLNQSTEEWDVFDNENLRLDEMGEVNHSFSMPTLGHARCMFEAQCKSSEFSDNFEFTVIPGQASYVLFIPAGGDVTPGAPFALKMRMMDDYDNPIDGIEAGFRILDSNGGEWTLSDVSSLVTGNDGGITTTVTPPAELGSFAVLEVVSDSLSEEMQNTVRFETADVDISQPARSEGDFAGGFSDEEFAGEFDDEPVPNSDEPQPADDVSQEMPLDIALGEEGLAGLPEIPEDSDEEEPAGDFAPAPADELTQPGTPGGVDALDGFDYGDAADPVDWTPGADEAPADPIPEGGALDAMEAALGYEEPAPADLSGVAATEEELTASNQPADDLSAAGPDDSQFVMPDDVDDGFGDVAPVHEEEDLTAAAGDSLVMPDDTYGEEQQYGETSEIAQPAEPAETGYEEPDEYTESPAASEQYEEPAAPEEYTQYEEPAAHEPGAYDDSSAEPADPVPPADTGYEEPQATDYASDDFAEPAPPPDGDFAPPADDYSGDEQEYSDAPSDQTQYFIDIGQGYVTCEQGGTATISVRLTDELGDELLSPAIVIFEIAEDIGAASGAQLLDENMAPVGKTYETQTGAGSQAAAGVQVSDLAGVFTVNVFAGSSAAALTVEAGGGTPAEDYPASPMQDFGDQPAGEPDMGATYDEQTGEYREPDPYSDQYESNGEYDETGDIAPPTEEMPIPPPLVDAGAGAPPPPPPPQVMGSETQDPGLADSGAPPPPPDATGALPPPPESQDFDYSDLGIDDFDDTYIEEEDSDPYSIPAFEVKTGKSPGVQMNAILPRVLKLGVIGLTVAVLVIGGLIFYKKGMYQYYEMQGNKYFRSNMFTHAITNMKKAHEMDPEQIVPLKRLSQMHISNAESAKKRGDEAVSDAEIALAIDYIQQWLRLEPNNIDAIENLGDCYEHKQEYCKAMQQYERILRIDQRYQTAIAKKDETRTKCDMQKGFSTGRGQ